MVDRLSMSHISSIERPASPCDLVIISHACSFMILQWDNTWFDRLLLWLYLLLLLSYYFEVSGMRLIIFHGHLSLISSMDSLTLDVYCATNKTKSMCLVTFLLSMPILRQHVQTTSGRDLEVTIWCFLRGVLLFDAHVIRLT